MRPNLSNSRQFSQPHQRRIDESRRYGLNALERNNNILAATDRSTDQLKNDIAILIRGCVLNVVKNSYHHENSSL